MANPNPSPETRFGAENGNAIAGGKSSKQRELEYRAAEDAAELRARMLSIIKETTRGNDAALLEYLRSDTLKLFKDSEDRAHGTPQQAVDMTTNGDKVGMPSTIILKAADDPSDD